MSFSSPIAYQLSPMTYQVFLHLCWHLLCLEWLNPHLR